MTQEDRSDETLRTMHRDASAGRDEHPRAGVRAIVMAEAEARAARPTGASGVRRRFRAMAIAASIVAAAAAGLVANETYLTDLHRVDRGVAIVASVSGSSAEPPAVAVPSTDPAPAATDATPQGAATPRSTPAPARPPARAAAPHGAPSGDAARSRRAADPVAALTRPSDSAEHANAFQGHDGLSPDPAAAVTQAAAAPQPAPSLFASGGAAANGHESRQAAATVDSQRSFPAQPSLMAGRFAAPDEPIAAWVARIVALRKAGRDDDADRELAALRRRHPAAVVPPNALGTGDAR